MGNPHFSDYDALRRETGSSTVTNEKAFFNRRIIIFYIRIIIFYIIRVFISV